MCGAEISPHFRNEVATSTERSDCSQLPAPMARLSSHPCVVHDLRHYSAALRQKWTYEYLCGTHGSTPGEVSLSQTGMLEGALDEHETLTMDFGETFMAQSDASWRRKPSKVHLHLAQCPLAQLPALHADVSPPDEVLAAAGPSQPAAHLWLCIGAGRSSLHYDGSDGLLLVVRGHKKLTLLPPSATRLPLGRPRRWLRASLRKSGWRLRRTARGWKVR